MKIKVITTSDPEYKRELYLRDEVLRKPIGLCLFDECLSKEGEHIHIVAETGGKVVGCLMLTKLSDGTIKMRQVAVDPEHQRQGAGKAMVLFSENHAKEKGFKEIILHARQATVQFYQKLGYTTVGQEFLEVTIPHIKMVKRFNNE